MIEYDADGVWLIGDMSLCDIITSVPCVSPTCVDDMKDDFIQQVPTGKGPDIVMGAHDWLGELSTNGVVAPIELGDSSEDYLACSPCR